MKKRLKKDVCCQKKKEGRRSFRDGIKEGAKQADKRFSAIGKPIENFMGMLWEDHGHDGKILCHIWSIKLDIQKHPEQVTKLVRLIFAIGKFGFIN